MTHKLQTAGLVGYITVASGYCYGQIMECAANGSQGLVLMYSAAISFAGFTVWEYFRG